MKNALIIFRDESKEYDFQYLGKITDLFKNAGYPFSSIEMYSTGDEVGFRRGLNNFRDTADNLVIISGNERFDAKGVIAESCGIEYKENETAKTFLDAINITSDTEYSKKYAYIPEKATLIPNLSGPIQGFILDDGEFTLSYLPNEYSQMRTMVEKFVLPKLDKNNNIHQKRITLKYFGERERLENVLDRAKGLSEQGIKYFITERYGDIKIDISFNKTENIDTNESVRYIVGELKEDIYAEYDVSLSERLFDILKLKDLKIAVAESFTGGRVTSELIKNSGASKYVMEGIISYSNESKIERLGVDRNDLEKNGAVSSIVAYEMAMGLLSKGVDIAISTTGIAGPKRDDTLKPVGLCYIAIGMKDGIHAYKYNLSGSREEITETAKNTALFLAIKKLKNN